MKISLLYVITLHYEKSQNANFLHQTRSYISRWSKAGNYRGIPSISGMCITLYCTHSESVKEVVPWLLVIHEQFQVLEDLFFDGHLVVVADRVLPEKVKLHHVLLTIHLLVKS